MITTISLTNRFLNVRRDIQGLRQKQPRRCSKQKAVLKISAIFTGKHFCWSLFLIRMQALRPTTLLKRDFNTGVFPGLEACNFIKKRFQHRCFPVNTAKFLITTILKNTCEQVLRGLRCLYNSLTFIILNNFSSLFKKYTF